MYQVLTYVQPNGYIILKETNDYEEAKKFFDDIKTEEKLAGEFICHYEIVEVENDILKGISKKSDSIIKLERKD